jgi:proline iminopeptidase
MLRTFYPTLEPYNTFRLPVSDIHTLYVEESGNPQGKPVLFVHGGPGAASSPKYRGFFNPEKYRIILFDQRGCGKSTPFANLEENTTWDLVEDMERIRRQLGIDTWMLFGGSWGSTLALCYAMTHPDKVTEMVLRGIFTLRKSELWWFYQEGASHLFADYWQPYWNEIPAEERGDMIQAYYKRLTSDNQAVRLSAAKAWTCWEAATSKLYPDPKTIEEMGKDTYADAFARIECHYFVNEAFLERDGWLLEKENIDKIRHIPAVIVQGRYDVVCPLRSAWDLHTVWPEAALEITPTSGHASTEPENLDKLVEWTDRFGGVEA